ncbi:hypothetical protein [Paenibacillus humicus]|uniref:hypothetical protein n=1 Tax=Paenibacillus humicus TaxID=412861 RepID=UPI0013E32BD8|nr:hypothetical protein [Paenibacillus humicus]
MGWKAEMPIAGISMGMAAGRAGVMLGAEIEKISEKEAVTDTVPDPGLILDKSR